jgi:DNA-binding response OmpR family regulator
MQGRMTDTPPVRRPLRGVRLLVVEDDPLLLFELESVMLDAGAHIVGLCRSVADAMPVARDETIAAAILDFRLGSETVEPVARCLAQRGIPFILYTGQAVASPELAGFHKHPILQKPARPKAVIAAVLALVP